MICLEILLYIRNVLLFPTHLMCTRHSISERLKTYSWFPPGSVKFMLFCKYSCITFNSVINISLCVEGGGGGVCERERGRGHVQKMHVVNCIPCYWPTYPNLQHVFNPGIKAMKIEFPPSLTFLFRMLQFMNQLILILFSCPCFINQPIVAYLPSK